MSYVELHSRSAFSFLRGASRPEQFAEVAAQLQIPAMALCDRDGVYGAPLFFGAAKERGIRPIVGTEFTMEDETILPVLVENRVGYQNLCRLLTRAHLRSEKGKAQVRWGELPAFANGLVALTGAEDGPLMRAIVGGKKTRPLTPALSPQGARENLIQRGIKYRGTRTAQTPRDTFPLPLGGEGQGEGVNHVLQTLKRIFGPANVFIEIQRHYHRGEEQVNKALIELAAQHHLPLLATNGVLYAEPNGRRIIDVFTCIRNHTHLDAAGLLLEQNSERYLKSPEQMRELFRDLPEAIENTTRLARRLEFSLENLGYEFPRFPVGPGETMDDVLRQKTFEGAQKRYRKGVPEKVRKQLENELALIRKLGVAGYFLIVWDIVEFCREQNIIAQGRGSAANSSVCFCLGITAVDPLKFHTLFERFLSEGRKNCWPDIDIDLPSGDRREKVIQEVYKRYGKCGAAMTANVICYRGRSAAREIGKALNISNDVLDRFSNLFANGDFPHTLDFAAQINKAGLPSQHPRAFAFATLYREMTEHALPRHLGQHSGGMIICQGQLDSIVPLENASMPGRVVAQWDKDDCERLGIIKVDFLGLGMMSVIQDAVELSRARGKSLDLANLPEHDEKTFEMIRAADTVGVFQIESRAQMATLPRMKPKNFYDIVIEVAIIRPGPIQGNLMHPYLKRRAQVERGADPKQFSCYHEDLRPILERTLGIPLFQEQMLEMAAKMTDFTPSEAEELRRALSFHRSDKEMKQVEGKLRAAMKRKGHSEKVIDEVAQAVSSFALYGFPESHAISFALLAYATAYLKAHYAPEFYASLLNNQPMGFYSSATIIKDAQRHGMKFRPVCVACSEWNCTIEGRAGVPRVSELNDKAMETGETPVLRVRLGLRVVRGLSEGGAQRLLAERKKAPFTSLHNFKRRMRLNKDELRTLAGIGALNCFAAHRRNAMWGVETEVRDDLFDAGGGSGFSLVRCNGVEDALVLEEHGRDARPITSPLAPMTYPERIQADFSGMQLTTGRHPMALLRPRLNGIFRAADLPKAKHGSTVRIAGNVICRQRPGTAKGFVFITLEDETGMSNAIVTPPLFEKLRLVITQESFLTIEGRIQNTDNVILVRAEKIERLASENFVASKSHDFS
jgi:error-prone DNA polymerase